jgi:hypothetical protein
VSLYRSKGRIIPVRIAQNINTEIPPASGKPGLDLYKIALKSNIPASERIKKRMKFTGENEKQTAGRNTRSPTPNNTFNGLYILNLIRNTTRNEIKIITMQPVKFRPAYLSPFMVWLSNIKRRNDKARVKISNNNGTAIYLKS